MPESFMSLGVPADLTSCLEGLGIKEPYPIQTATLPDGLAGRDLFAQSPTGSGKTLAYAIPLVSRIGRAESRRPRALVLSPTRELAAQITKVIQPLARLSGKRVAAFYGGTGYKPQLTALRNGTDIVVGCPGRLIDLLDRRALNLADIEVVVIDEADRMADMGFLPAVRRLLDEIRGQRQTMLFSATLTRDVERLVREYQRDPKRHVLELASDDVSSRSHEFWRADRSQRIALTARIVSQHDSSIVFCRTKRGADRLTHHLEQLGVAAVAIHGDRSQAQRDRALAQFRDRHAQVLVGTDVASRGLHVDGVDCVVHFDPPEDDDTYVHRSGRTGRAGSTGVVVSLISSEQEKLASQMQRRLGIDAPFVKPGPAGEITVSPARFPRQPTEQRPPRRRNGAPGAVASASTARADRPRPPHRQKGRQWGANQSRRTKPARQPGGRDFRQSRAS